MSKKRMLFVVFLCAFLPLGWDAAIDQEWPDWSLQHWLVFLAGLVVIAVVGMVFESLVEARRARSEGSASDTAGFWDAM